MQCTTDIVNLMQHAMKTVSMTQRAPTINDSPQRTMDPVGSAQSLAEGKQLVTNTPDAQRRPQMQMTLGIREKRPKTA
jgi:hypothetical protein